MPKGNQNPSIEEEQTTQWPKEKGKKDKQRSTKQPLLYSQASNAQDWCKTYKYNPHQRPLILSGQER